MSWYKEKGPESEIVLSTRVRFARNLPGYKFPSKMTEEERSKLIGEVSDAFFGSNSTFSDNFRLLKTKEETKDRLLSLYEKHLISRELIRNPLPSAVIMGNDEKFSLMLLEEDHVRLQVILPGNQMKEALKMAKDYEKLLDGRLSFSRNESLGYLTACPTNLGTGLRISVMLHLPALTVTKKIGRILNSVGKLGLTIRGMHGEGTEAKGSFYQLSNQVTLGMNEEDILKKVDSVLVRIIEIEKNLREELLKNAESEIKNKCMRAYGILKNSYALTSEEAITFLSDVRLGKALGFLEADYTSLNTFMVLSSPYYLSSEENLKDPNLRDIRRASLAKEIL